MAHHVGPKDGNTFRAPDEIVTILLDEFGYVDADPEAGSDHVGAVIAQLLRMQEGFARWKEPPPEAAEIATNIVKLQAAREHAIKVTIGDDPSSEFGYLDFAVIPGEPLFVGYCCRQHETESAPLLARLAAALNYDVVLT